MTTIDLDTTSLGTPVNLNIYQAKIVWQLLIGCENDPEPLDNLTKIKLNATATQDTSDNKSVFELLTSAANQIQKKLQHIPGYLWIPDDAVQYKYDGVKLELNCAYKLVDDNPLTAVLAFNYEKMLRQAHALNNSVQELLLILNQLGNESDELDVSYLIARVSDFVGLPDDIKEFTTESKAIAEQFLIS